MVTDQQVFSSRAAGLRLRHELCVCEEAGAGGQGRRPAPRLGTDIPGRCAKGAARSPGRRVRDRAPEIRSRADLQMEQLEELGHWLPKDDPGSGEPGARESQGSKSLPRTVTVLPEPRAPSAEHLPGPDQGAPTGPSLHRRCAEKSRERRQGQDGTRALRDADVSAASRPTAAYWAPSAYSRVLYILTSLKLSPVLRGKYLKTYLKLAQVTCPRLQSQQVTFR